MSVLLMSQVWGLELPHGQQGVLLALCDHADDDGANCFPSVPYLAWKTGFSERQVQRLLHDLEAARLIAPIAYQQGGRGHATQYHIHIVNGVKKSPFIPPKGARVSPFASESAPVKGDISVLKGDKCSIKGDKCSIKGDICDTAIYKDARGTIREPSGNHQLEPSEREASAPAQGNTQPSTPPAPSHKKATPCPSFLPVTEQMAAWAKENAPGVSLKTQTEQFIDFHTAKGSTFKDWQAAWRTWIRRAAIYAKESQSTNGTGQAAPARAAPYVSPAVAAERQFEREKQARAERNAERDRAAENHVVRAPVREGFRH